MMIKCYIGSVLALIAGGHALAKEPLPLPGDVPPVLATAVASAPEPERGDSQWEIRLTLPRVAWEVVGKMIAKRQWPELKVIVEKETLTLRMGGPSQLAPSRVVDIQGKELGRGQVLKRLAAETPVLVSVSGRMPDAYYLQLTRPEAFIVLLGPRDGRPAPELLPSKAPPAAKTERIPGPSGPSKAKDGQITIDINVDWPKNRPTIVAPLQFFDSVPAIACELNGRPALFLVDTGAKHVCLFQDRLKKYGIKNLGASNIVTVTAAGRTANSVWSGPFTLSIQDVLPVKISSAICVPASARTDNQDFDGILSASLMKALNCVIDLKEARITFHRNKTNKAPGTKAQPQAE